MRYWAYFVAKVGTAAALMYGLLRALNAMWPAQVFRVRGEHAVWAYQVPRFGDLGYTFMVGLWFLLGCGLLYLAVLDQRHRCRVCLRRLRMPIETGSWGRMLQFGRPRIEYICPYGHGTLKEAELQISGLENAEWTPHQELWTELCATSREAEREE
ncbi:MAG: hypothetical protein M1436_03370 [Acidobacteria bacterium]|nr:hypothetical protein [Acidobacteriota bacterium]